MKFPANYFRELIRLETREFPEHKSSDTSEKSPTPPLRQFTPCSLTHRPILKHNHRQSPTKRQITYK